nr:ORF3 [Banfec anellovirus 2]
MGLQEKFRLAARKKAKAILLRNRRLRRGRGDGGRQLFHAYRRLAERSRASSPQAQKKATQKATCPLSPRPRNPTTWIDEPFWKTEVKFDLKLEDSDTDFSDFGKGDIDDIWGAPSTESDSSLNWSLSPIHRP